MGMFDRVKRDAIECPNCGTAIDDFQTKSGINQLLSLTPEQLVEDAKRFDCSQPYYYGFCPNCGTEVDFEYIPGHWEETHETREARNERYKKEDEWWKKYHEKQEKT